VIRIRPSKAPVKRMSSGVQALEIDKTDIHEYNDLNQTVARDLPPKESKWRQGNRTPEDFGPVPKIHKVI